MRQHSSSGKRTTQQLAESLHRRLNAYALAATAAGVGMLALAQAGEAKIVYTPAHVGIKERQRYNLDLNHDGVIDFVLLNRYVASTILTLNAVPQGTNQVWGYPINSEFGAASALAAGVRVGANKERLGKDHSVMVSWLYNRFSDTSLTRWPWNNVSRRYLGLRFLIHGEVHYGWARLNVAVSKRKITATLTGYAYETIPNKPIITGRTKGPDVITVQPATLGHLAAGASAISTWRAESVGIAH